MSDCSSCRLASKRALLPLLLVSTFLCAGGGVWQVSVWSVHVCAWVCMRGCVYEGVQVLSNGRAVEVGGKKVYVIFDTGTTGLTVTRDLYESVQRDYQGAPCPLATPPFVCAFACANACVCLCACVCV